MFTSRNKQGTSQRRQKRWSLPFARAGCAKWHRTWDHRVWLHCRRIRRPRDSAKKLSSTSPRCRLCRRDPMYMLAPYNLCPTAMSRDKGEQHALLMPPPSTSSPMHNAKDDNACTSALRLYYSNNGAALTKYLITIAMTIVVLLLIRRGRGQ